MAALEEEEPLCTNPSIQEKQHGRRPNVMLLKLFKTFLKLTSTLSSRRIEN